MKVTDDPAQDGFSDTAILTLAASTGFTTMVIVFDEAGLPEAQVTSDVSVQ